MNETTKPSVPISYWIVAVVALLWNLIGCLFFSMELFAQEAMMEGMTEEQKEWARSFPGWIYGVYFVAVSTGVAGSIGLLMRKAWSVPLFAISLVAVVIQMGYTELILGGLEVMGPSGAVMPILVTVLAAAFLWFSLRTRK